MRGPVHDATQGSTLEAQCDGLKTLYSPLVWGTWPPLSLGQQGDGALGPTINQQHACLLMLVISNMQISLLSEKFKCLQQMLK